MNPAGTDLVLDLRTRVGEGGSLSALDKRLLKYAAERKSPDEMSDLLGGGLTPARCGQRVKEILASKDWLSIVEQQAVLMHEMVELKSILFEAVKSEGSFVELQNGREVFRDPDPRWSANLIRLFKEFRSFIADMEARVEGQAVTLREAHATILRMAIEVIFERFVLELEKEYGDIIDRRRMMEMMEEVIPQGLETIESKVAE